MSFFVFLYGLCFKVCFVWYVYCNSYFLSFPFSLNIFLHPLNFNLYVPFALRWVSYRHHVVCFFLIQSATLYLLIGTLTALPLKVIINKSIYFHFKPCFPVISMYFLVFFFLFLLNFFLVFYDCVLFFFAFSNVFLISICGCPFFKYVKPFLYLLALAW